MRTSPSFLEVRLAPLRLSSDRDDDDSDQAVMEKSPRKMLAVTFRPVIGDFGAPSKE
jgi:hypothetical protein